MKGSPFDFGGRVVSGFQRSQGVLLAGAVASYTLLAIVPLFVVLLVGLSHVVDEHRLLDTVASNLQLVIPSQAAVVTEQVESFLAHREVVGIVGLLALVFFSSTAFTVIESALAIIFCHRTVTQHRHFLVSVLLPYLFIMLIGVGLLLITVISSALHAVRAVRVFGHTWPPAGLPGAVLYLLGVVGLALLLTAFYMVLPVGRIRFGHALAGGVTATVLWEAIRRVLVWYFAKLSMAIILLLKKNAPSLSPLVLSTLPHRAGRGRAPATPCYTVRTMSDDAPKSAFELAMQRLRQKDKETDVDARPLTDAQKAAIAEARQVYKAKTAEREILHQAALRKAATREEVELLNENLRRDLGRLASDRDRKIAEIRGEASP